MRQMNDKVRKSTKIDQDDDSSRPRPQKKLEARRSRRAARLAVRHVSYSF